MFVKPANLGSSVGISKVKTAGTRARAGIRRRVRSQNYRGAGIAGREFECAVLGNDEPVAAVPCEILPSREFYDYEDKYLLDAGEDGAARRPDA